MPSSDYDNPIIVTEFINISLDGANGYAESRRQIIHFHLFMYLKQFYDLLPALDTAHFAPPLWYLLRTNIRLLRKLIIERKPDISCPLFRDIFRKCEFLWVAYDKKRPDKLTSSSRVGKNEVQFARFLLIIKQVQLTHWQTIFSFLIALQWLLFTTPWLHFGILLVL